MQGLSWFWVRETCFSLYLYWICWSYWSSSQFQLIQLKLNLFQSLNMVGTNRSPFRGHTAVLTTVFSLQLWSQLSDWAQCNSKSCLITHHCFIVFGSHGPGISTWSLDAARCSWCAGSFHPAVAGSMLTELAELIWHLVIGFAFWELVPDLDTGHSPVQIKMKKNRFLLIRCFLPAGQTGFLTPFAPNTW